MNEYIPSHGCDHWMTQILQYLHDKPEAKDTFEGICQWWVTSSPNEQDSKYIQEALSYLAEQQVIHILEIGLGQKIYGMNKDNMHGIQDILSAIQNR